MARILVIEDEPILRRNIVDRLRAEGHEVSDTSSGETGVELCTLLAPDLVLTDLRLPGIDGLEVLAHCKSVSARTLVVVITAHGTPATAIEAMRRGAYDYLNKPVELKELVLLVERAMSHSRALDKVQYARDVEREKGRLERIVGVSRNIQDIKQRIWRLACSPAMTAEPPNVLIVGETGTGKDLVAHAIHNEGPRASGPFVQVHCAAISEDIIEGELFGRVRNALPGAASPKKGLFEVAEGGTIYLDEVGHMSAALQARLLKTLETRRNQPVGARDERSIDTHVIASTSRNLEDAITHNEFRADLYHRLRVIELCLHPLRDRADDIPLLAELFVEYHARRFRRASPHISEVAIQVMAAYRWPGNVRELSNVIEGALLACDGAELEPDHLRLSVPDDASTMKIRIAGHSCVDIDLEGGGPTLREIEQRIVAHALELNSGDVERTARALGISVEEVHAHVRSRRDDIPRHG